MLRIAQRAMKQMVGYFGGYISKRQKVGQYELKKSIGSLPLLKQKLAKRGDSASRQLAAVCNRMFTTLESKGILRTAPEEFMLASQYRPDDELFAEFIRTFRTTYFFGRYYVERFDALAENRDVTQPSVLLPKMAASPQGFDYVSVYGFRPMHPHVFYLSPWEFVQWWKPHRLRPPTDNYTLTR